MPPHCDTLDGPVVSAARRALETDDVDVILPFVPADGEAEIQQAFDLARKARVHGAAAREVADLYFFDTAVRVHRRGEGAPHTGLKPAGLDAGPAIPLAERAVQTGEVDELVAFLQHEVGLQVQRRLEHVRELQRRVGAGVPAARMYTSAMLGFLVWAHKLWLHTQQSDDHHRGS
jgi:hypothetical protein